MWAKQVSRNVSTWLLTCDFALFLFCLFFPLPASPPIKLCFNTLFFFMFSWFFYFSFIFCQSTLKQIIYYFIEVGLIFLFFHFDTWSSDTMVGVWAFMFDRESKVSLRQAGIWDRSGTLCFGNCTWTNVSLEQRNTKQLWGMENNCMHVQLGQIRDKRCKKAKNPTTTSEKPRVKAEHWTCPLHPTPPKGRTSHQTTPPLGTALPSSGF